MKTAFISTIQDYPWGGADALWTPAAEAAAQRGDQLFLAVNAMVAAHPRVRALLTGGAQWHDCTPAAPSLTQRAMRRLHLATSSSRLTTALAAFRPDRVVISLGATYDLVSAPELAAWLQHSGTPFRLIANWQSTRPVLSDAERRLALASLQAAEIVFFVSEANRATTRRHLLSPLPNARVVHYPIPLAAGALPWPGETPWRLAAVARWEPIKGLDLLLHAVADALGHETEWHLALFGRGPEAGHLAEIIAHYGLQDRVTLRGYADDIDAVWRDHHLLISSASDEGVPLTLPEAVLRGRPVLATDVGGAADWIIPDETGFICAAPTHPLLVEALRHAWAARATWSEMGRRAAQVFAARHRPDDFKQVIEP